MVRPWSDPSTIFPFGVIVDHPNSDTEDSLSSFEQVVLARLFFHSCNLLFKKTVLFALAHHELVSWICMSPNCGLPCSTSCNNELLSCSVHWSLRFCNLSSD